MSNTSEYYHFRTFIVTVFFLFFWEQDRVKLIKPMTQQAEQIVTRGGDTHPVAPLREGFTTGACAAAATKAAVLGLLGGRPCPPQVIVPFPSGETISFKVEWLSCEGDSVVAAVRKDAGDDPDVTHKALIVAQVRWCADSEIRFEAGEGVGRVTKPGLSIPPGEPAINPGPRKMICAAIREVTDRGVRVILSIPGGEELAKKTFNPRLGIVGGLSILGTTGRVRPFSCQAIRCSVACELDVAQAAGVTHPVLVPGHIGERSARRQLKLSEDQLIEVGNEWGFVLEGLHAYSFTHVLLWGHPGKLAKLAGEAWDTHSSRSRSAIEIIRELLQDGAAQGGADIGASLPCQARVLPDTAVSVCAHEALTAEGFFEQLDELARERVARRVCQAVSAAAYIKCAGACRISVAFVNLAGDLLASHGGLEKWM